MLLGWTVSEIKFGLGAWSRMNQFRSIMGRAQPAILRFVSIVALFVSNDSYREIGSMTPKSR